MEKSELIKFLLQIPQHHWSNTNHGLAGFSVVFYTWNILLFKDVFGEYNIRIVETAGGIVCEYFIKEDDPNYNLLHHYFQTIRECYGEKRRELQQKDFEHWMQMTLYGDANGL
jgi:hypothetical protein